MTLDTFKLIHSELIQQVQCVEYNLKVIYEEMKEGDFKKNYKDPFTENFCFLILNLSKCPSCESLFGISGFNIAMFLQLDVLKLESNVSDLIKDYFTPKIDVANYNCSNCGCQGKKLRQKLVKMEKTKLLRYC